MGAEGPVQEVNHKIVSLAIECLVAKDYNNSGARDALSDVATSIFVQ